MNVTAFCTGWPLPTKRIWRCSELGQPFTIALDSTQQVSLNLQGSSQLEISCVAANEDSTTSSGDDIDVAIGNARLSPP